MQPDPIVEEMRKVGETFARDHGNDFAAILKALREKEVRSGRVVVTRQPHRIAAALPPNPALARTTDAAG